MLLSRGHGALRPLVRMRSPLQPQPLTRSVSGSGSSAVSSACGSRFLQQSRSFGSFGSASASRAQSSGKRAASSFFLDAQVACKGKRCSLSQFDGKNSRPEGCGEDSYFLSPYIVGVADGVGGWNENGVDPGEISRSLMRNAGEFVRSAKSEVTTQAVLAYGYKQALLDDNVRAGSTTACIVRLTSADDGRLVLQYTNLGDSGFAILRDGQVIFRSKFQYYGRAPYQLAKIPPEFKSYGAIENHPNDANSGEIEVQHGDLVVLATDGVWDNFSPDLLATPAYSPPLRSWRRFWQNEVAAMADVIKEAPEKAADNIVRASVRHNLKPDDVTVIVAKVVLVEAKL